jgi:hypothetical protein
MLFKQIKVRPDRKGPNTCRDKRRKRKEGMRRKSEEGQ